MNRANRGDLMEAIKERVRKIFFGLLIITIGVLINVELYAQDQEQDVVHLKNGSIILGHIIEVTPAKEVRIQTKDGSLFVYDFKEIDKIEMNKIQTKEAKTTTKEVDKSIAEEKTNNTKDKGGYVGICASYSLDQSDVNINGMDTDFDNTFGLQFNGGYRFNKNIALQIEFSYLPGYKYEKDINTGYDSVDASIEAEANIKTYGLAGKFSVGSHQKLMPYLLVGLGRMELDCDIDATGSVSGYGIVYSESGSVSEIDLYYKVGAGVDYLVKDNISLGFGADYVMGSGDLDDVAYININLGGNYYF